MAVIQPQTKKRTMRSEEEILREATLRLMRGIKEHAKANRKPLGRRELLKKGYSAKFIDSLEAA